MSADIARPRAVITGASSGIGAATALALARRGHDIAVTYRGEEAGAKETAAAAERLGVRAHVARLDLAEPESIPAVMEELIAELGGVDVLVNNAGVNRRRSALEEDLAGWRQTLDVNLVGPCLCARGAAEAMRAAGRGGRIVNVSSILAFSPLAGGLAYGAAKAALEAATKVMALEWAPDGIRVNAVAPGHTATPMNFDAGELDGSAIARPVIPLARAARAEEIAAAIAFLAGEEASYVTGTSLLVDGGLILPSGPSSLQDATGLPPEKRL